MGLLHNAAQAQSLNTHDTSSSEAWQTCRALRGDAARLACFDRWAATAAPTTQARAMPAPTPLTIQVSTADSTNCTSHAYSELSRFWELESGTDCDTFGLRGYRPISLAVIGSNGVNVQPSTPAPGHSAASTTPYRNTETRAQLSVRTKIAQGLLTGQSLERRDSIWFAYSQQSYWQLFSPHLSRPFRNTDHEPEFIYVYPTDFKLSNGWRLRYAGTGLVHQSNGQSLPLSRSWNRVYLMAGVEKDSRFTLQARFWQRVPERASDDDNPDIANYVGRGELAASWNLNPSNTLGLTLRHSLRADARGSTKLEWFRTLGSRPGDTHPSQLRFHTQLFSGYGDSLVDYNRRRTVFSLGLSLADF